MISFQLRKFFLMGKKKGQNFEEGTCDREDDVDAQEQGYYH